MSHFLLPKLFLCQLPLEGSHATATQISPSLLALLSSPFRYLQNHQIHSCGNSECSVLPPPGHHKGVSPCPHTLPSEPAPHSAHSHSPLTCTGFSCSLRFWHQQEPALSIPNTAQRMQNSPASIFIFGGRAQLFVLETNSTDPYLLFLLLFFSTCPSLWKPQSPGASSAALCKHTLLCAGCLNTEPGERGQEFLLDQVLPIHVAQVEPVIYLICTVTIISFWNQPRETGTNKRVTFGGEEFLICAQTEEILLLCYLGNDTMREENKIIHVPNSLLSSSTNIYFEEPQCRFLLQKINDELCPPPKQQQEKHPDCLQRQLLTSC